MNHPPQQSDSVVGNTVKVEFAAFGNRTCEGKVDTGATTSSLHATKIQINQQQGQVSFQSECLSDNTVTLELKGVQEVHSADAGGVPRPIVAIDVVIDGKAIKGATFNLNDRGNMDTKILIGQNILKAGQFMIDPSKDQETTDAALNTMQPGPTNEAAVLAAVEVLIENNVTLKDIVTYLHTAAINRIKE